MNDTNFNELDYTCGVSDEELLYRFKEAVRIENEIKKVKGLPIAKYDFEKNAPSKSPLQLMLLKFQCITDIENLV